MSIQQVVSFSGGRTSAYLVHLMEQRRAAGEDVRYIFTDTGAEHPKTYEFIRNVVTHWGIDLICLRLVVNPKLGEANSYRVVGVDGIGPDLEPFRAALSKYGTPYVGGRFCTRTMKIEPFDRYCKDNFPQSEKWLGIRTDEPKRLTPKPKTHYLADISDMEKKDIINWWSQQPFDLDLPEHLGNCVFCIEKGINKIALAARDEPQMAAEFWNLVNEPGVRVVERCQQENKIMYRGNNSLESVIALFSEHSREEIVATIRGGGGYDSGSCTESCEAFTCGIDADQIEDPNEQPAVSAYCLKLAELREKPNHLLKEIGDQWRTPDDLWWGMNAKFGPFVLDLFADEHNAKCEAFYTAEDNALTQDWSARLEELGGAAYANPPYSRAQQHDGQYITGMAHIMQHTMAMRKLGGRYVYLIKAATSESWWPEDADHIAFIRGRIGFDVPDWFVPADDKQKPSGAFFAGAIAVFDKNWRGPATSYINREELEAMGRMFINQIQRAALRIQGIAA
ncbi:phage N-6-adenine-methyltransferase [Serratia liquefaciens]|uniref:phage N-6-adenine-methyltransferase n=1 Tax=Serratia liquefaciens TaxID=614 RepID=UPI003905F0D1